MSKIYYYHLKAIEKEADGSNLPFIERSQIAQACEAITKQQMKEFAEWKDENYFTILPGTYILRNTGLDERFTTDQLLELYLKENE